MSSFQALIIVFLVLIAPIFTIAQNNTDTFKVKAKVDPKRVFTFVEENPEFPGGEAELLRTIERYIVYPEAERLKGIQGKVRLQFVVDTDGMISDARIIQGVSPGLDSAALHALDRFPKFRPGKNHGKPVPVYYNLPVDFRLTK